MCCSLLQMYFAHMRPFACSRRRSAGPSDVFFLSFAGTPIKNIGVYCYIWISCYFIYWHISTILGRYLMYFLKIFGGVHVTPTYIRKLFESDVAAFGTEEDRKFLSLLYSICYSSIYFCVYIIEDAMHTAQQHSAETARLHYQMDVSLVMHHLLYLKYFKTYLCVAHGRTPSARRRVQSWAFRWHGSSWFFIFAYNWASCCVYPRKVPHRLVHHIIILLICYYIDFTS